MRQVRAFTQFGNIRFAAFLSTIALLSAAACAGATTGPSGGLAGNWQTWPLVPSGSSIEMSLAASGANVMGTGRASELQRDLGLLTIAGQQRSDSSFRLSVTYDENGAVATYSGRMLGPNELDGTWTTGAQSSYSLTFKRQ